MRDPRYWQSGHPERNAYNAWVSDGWQALGKASPGGRTAEGLVFVRAYDRTRNGQAEHVSAHTRSAPPGQAGDAVPGAVRVAMMSADPVFRDWIGGPVDPGRILGPGVGGGRMMPPTRVPPRAIPQGRPGVGVRPRGGLGSRSWHNQIPKQPGEEDAESEAQGASAPAEALLPSPPTIDELIAASPKTGSGLGNSDANQHTRGGGEAQREADVKSITNEPGKVVGPNRTIYPLPDGRQIMTRPSSNRQQYPTLEVFKPDPEAPGRFIPTQKIRY